MRRRISSFSRNNRTCAVLAGLIALSALAIAVIYISIYTPIAQVRVNNLGDDVDSIESDVNSLEIIVNQLTSLAVGVVSQVYLSTQVNVTNAENFPFDVITSDPFSLYDNTSFVWVADRTGYWRFSVCYTFNQASTSGFPTTLTYDHQIQTYIDNTFAAEGGFFLALLTVSGDSPAPQAVQKTLCGENVYRLTVGQNISCRAQTRIYPFNIVNSIVDGGSFVATRASLVFIGQIP